MKIHYRILCFAMAAFAMLAVSCQKEEDTVTLGAETQRPANADTKVYIDDHTPCWHNGDQIFINNASYPIISATGSSAQIQEVSRHDTYRAVFPAGIVSGTNISNSASVPVTLPTVQQYQMVGDHQRVDVPMGAYLTHGSTLQFHNLCSVVRVTVNNNMNNNIAVRAISLTATQARLSGSGTATVSGQASDRIAMSPTASHTVTLVMPEEAPVTVGALESKAFDIVVPSFTTDDITIHINTTEGYAYTTKSNVGLVNNTITTAACPVAELISYGLADLVSGTAFNSSIPSSATSIVFECNNSESSGTVLSTADSPVLIYGRLEGNVWHVCTLADTIYANPNCSGMFREKSNLTTINFGSGFNTENVTNMGYMFYGCSNLNSLNLSNFNTANVTNMSYMFAGSSIGIDGNFDDFDFEGLEHYEVSRIGDDFYPMRLTSINFGDRFNTASVTDMSYMFSSCSSLTTLDLSSFNTANVTNMSYIFYGCSSLTALDLSSFNTANVTDMSYMFSGRIYAWFEPADYAVYYNKYPMELTTIYFGNSFTTANVTDMSYMFNYCHSLTSINVSNFNTANVTNMESMFSSCSSLTSLNLSNFNTANVTDMSSMFSSCSSLTSLNLSNFNTANVTDMSYMFYNCSSLTSLNLSNFNTANVTDMCGMFGRCQSLTSLNLSNFNTANVTRMDYMFFYCSSLTSLNLSHFDMSNLDGWTGSYIYDYYSGRDVMCYNLSTTSGYCTITCPLAVQTELESGTDLPTSGVAFTWVRP